MNQEPFIVCENLVKIYKVAELEVVALQGLDLNIAPGELLGVVGASGSGKSSLLNILGGLDRPSAGRAWVDGRDLLKLNDFEMNGYRRNEVGFVWQQGSRNLISYLTARENIELPMLLAGSGGVDLHTRADELLEAVGLADRSHHHLVQMSGGEQQRVAIAVALVNRPKLLLADEPTGEVDTATALGIYQTFQKLSKDFGITTLIVSHDPGIAQHVDRVVAIRDGKLATETVRKKPALSLVTDDSKTAADTPQVEEYHELVVLDSAGRLQVPKDYLDKFQIKRRAQLEIVEEGILIRPAEVADHPATEGTAPAILSSAKQTISSDRLKKIWERFRPKVKPVENQDNRNE